MKLGGLQKFTLIDYPGKIACIVFSMGCNFRCPFCHNRELVLETAPEMPEREVFNFLEERQEKLGGVEVTGGEPTIHKDLPNFLERIKNLGFDVKLDSNGTNPEMLGDLIERDLVDYIAMDFKAPPSSYDKAAGVKVDLEKIRRSVELIKELKRYEFRTTAVPNIVDEEGIRKIAKTLKDANKICLQQFRPENTLDESYEETEPYSEEKLEKFKEIASSYVKSCEIRNI